MTDFEVSYQPREQEQFDYKIMVSRDSYDGYEKYDILPRTLEFAITISRTIEIRKNFCAYLT